MGLVYNPGGPLSVSFPRGQTSTWRLASCGCAINIKWWDDSPAGNKLRTSNQTELELRPEKGLMELIYLEAL